MVKDNTSTAWPLDALEHGPGRYEWSAARLVERLKLMRSSDYTPTPTRNELRRIAGKLGEVMSFLELDGIVQSEIEDAHGELFGEVGEASWTAYGSSLHQMRQLLASIDHACSRLPNSRERQALPFAAKVFLFLRFYYGFGQPRLTDDGHDVCEFESICSKAGFVLSRSALRGELSRARKVFDPFLFQPWHSDFV